MELAVPPLITTCAPVSAIGFLVILPTVDTGAELFTTKKTVGAFTGSSCQQFELFGLPVNGHGTDVKPDSPCAALFVMRASRFPMSIRAKANAPTVSINAPAWKIATALNVHRNGIRIAALVQIPGPPSGVNV